MSGEKILASYIYTYTLVPYTLTYTLHYTLTHTLNTADVSTTCALHASVLLLYCCFTAALLLLYCRFTAALLSLYCCFTVALLLRCLYACRRLYYMRPPRECPAALLLLYCCYTAAILLLLTHEYTNTLTHSSPSDLASAYPASSNISTTDISYI